MQNHHCDRPRSRTHPSTRPLFVVDSSGYFENAEDVNMEDDALSAIAAYKDATDRLMVESYAELAGREFNVRTAPAPVQAHWSRTPSPMRD